MIKNKLSEIMGRKRINKAELARFTGISYSGVKNLYYDRTKGIEYETLNKLCIYLKCTPNDILEFIPNE